MPIAPRPATAATTTTRSAARRVIGHVLLLGSLGFVSMFTALQAVLRLFR